MWWTWPALAAVAAAVMTADHWLAVRGRLMAARHPGDRLTPAPEASRVRLSSPGARRSSWSRGPPGCRPGRVPGGRPPPRRPR